MRHARGVTASHEDLEKLVLDWSSLNHSENIDGISGDWLHVVNSDGKGSYHGSWDGLDDFKSISQIDAGYFYNHIHLEFNRASGNITGTNKYLKYSYLDRSQYNEKTYSSNELIVENTNEGIWLSEKGGTPAYFCKFTGNYLLVCSVRGQLNGNLRNMFGGTFQIYRKMAY